MVEFKIKWQLLVSSWWVGADQLILTVKFNENKV